MLGRIVKLSNNEYLISDKTDINSLPSEVPIGAVAFTADEENIYRKDVDGTWATVKEKSEE